MARRPTTKGIEGLRSIVRGDTDTLIGKLERGFRRFLVDQGFPLPRTNRKEGAHYVDCRWVDHRLTVELDSYRFHGSRHAWDQDHLREQAARARGDEFRRFRWRDIFEDQTSMLAQLDRLLPRK